MTSILIVDDEEDIAEVTSEILIDEGYSVRIALNFNQAMEKLNEAIPDLLITDVNMPDKSGIELIAEIRKKFSKSFPIAVLSGLGNYSEKELLDAGANIVFIKPLNYDEFLINLDNFLREVNEKA